MTSYKLFFLFSFFFLIHFLYSTNTEATGPNFVDRICNTTKNFTSYDASYYKNNLRVLLGDLTSNAGKKEFYGTTVRIFPEDPSEIFSGLFMCSGYVNRQLCQQCVLDAVGGFDSEECDNSKEGIVWYEECMVRYSNRSFFSTVDTRPIKRMSSSDTVNVSNLFAFERFRSNTMSEMVDEAAKPALGEKKYAKKQANITGYQTLYCDAQCTPDLSPDDCRSCLNSAIEELSSAAGRILYPSCKIRAELYPFESFVEAVAPTPRNTSGHQGKEKSKSERTIVAVVIFIVVIFVVAVAILICFGCCFLWNKVRMSNKAAALRKNYFGSESTTLESLQFSLAIIDAATNKFSHENRIGKGGFGEVYKGILSDGREIAVKKLLKNSGQGATEFKNEVLLIAKLQHRNLVTLLGFCLEAQEKILVYEYVSNNSLDYFLFGSEMRRVLNWPERYNIIKGTARGILYLHEHSRLKVIHRDLKPSNILLDDQMNPKISDFGLAKMIAIDETEGSTNQIVGTIGYLSPEYAMLGQYSEKSDVFSFGVMILEIISGTKNTSCHESRNVNGLLSYAWKQMRDENSLEMLDSNMTEIASYTEVIKCIQIGLLCVQENPNARPSMATVVQYLDNDSTQLPFPQQPAFFMHGDMEPTIGAVESSFGLGVNNSKPCSVNEMSMSKFFPR